MKKGFVLLIIFCTVVFGAFWYMDQNQPKQTDMPIVTATIVNKTFRLHAPQTEKQRQTGLAAFDNLTDDEGMIFRGMPVGRQSIWMKDMKFDIDVLWVNKDNQIIHIVQGMSKIDQKTIYHNPDTTASAYVIELPNESCNKYGIAIGQIVSID